MFEYNSNIGSETLNKEFKVFNFYNIGLELSNEEAIDLILNKKWIFNNNILYNIKSMIKIYLPKYTCAYLSNKLNYNSELYFGIDDFGYIKGIPYQGDLDINYIKESLHEIINTYNSTDDNINILDYIHIDLIKINYKTLENLQETHKYYKEYKLKYNEYLQEKEKYIKKRFIWNKLAIRYNQKLVDLVNNNDTRYELINYIEYHSPDSHIIKLLKTDFLLDNTLVDNIIYYKNNKNNILYWLTEWKDKMLNLVKSIRPYFRFKIPAHLYPINILLAIDPMIHYWCKFNQNINLYLIKFIFKSHEKINIKYKNIYNEWTSCIRLLNSNGPCCQHV